MQHFSIETARLGNGLEVAVVEQPSPGVAVNLWCDVGSADESKDKTGFAHLFEHLMFQGSANVEPGEHMAIVESAGGTVNATTSSERTNYFETVPRGALELALWLEADRLGSLAITETNFEAQRQVVKEEKRQRYDNQPYGDLLQLLIEQHFPAEHPYGHLTIGSMEHLDAARLDDVADFFGTWYRASNIRLVLSGPLGAEEGFELAERYLGQLRNEPGLPPKAASAIPLNSPSTTVVSRDVPHSLAYVSWATTPATDDDQPAIDLALAILSDGHAARLHQRLVKQQRLAQTVQGGGLPNRLAPSLATLVVRPAEDVEVPDVVAALQDEMALFLEEGPTEREFERAVAQYERDWLSQLSMAESLADNVQEAWLLWGDPRRVNTRLDEVLSLSPEAVRDAARRWLTPDAAHQIHYLRGSR